MSRNLPNLEKTKRWRISCSYDVLNYCNCVFLVLNGPRYPFLSRMLGCDNNGRTAAALRLQYALLQDG
jgi:hypothetical protein